MFPNFKRSIEAAYQPEQSKTTDPHELSLGRATLECFKSENPQQRDYIERRLQRMNDWLSIFSGRVPQGVYNAAFLYEISGAFNVDDNLPDDLVPAREALLGEYLTNPNLTANELNYTMSIVGDLNFMDKEANNYRSNPNFYREGTVNGRFKEVIQDNYDQEILPDDWLMRAEVIDWRRMKGVLEEVNLEAVIIKAAQLIDDLHKSPEHSDPELLHKINESESFYAPICEIIGFDGMASTLRNTALSLRFEKSGRLSILERAKGIYQKAKDFSLDNLFELLGRADSAGHKFDFDPVLGVLSDGSRPVEIGDAILNLAPPLGAVGVSYRMKTIGSLADKIYNNQRYQETDPLDTIGLTIEVENDRQVEAALLHTIKQLQDAGVEFKSTPGKESPFYVQATQDQADYITEALAREGLDVQKKVIEPGRFQVAKMTAYMPNQSGEPVGVEIQFLTKADRRQARVGVTAHVLYKLARNLPPEELSELIDFMDDLNQRRQHMYNPQGGLTIKPNSLARSRELFPELQELNWAA